MNFEQISMVGEFVGGVGVLATLIFLLFEVRGNTKILKANASTEITNACHGPFFGEKRA